MKKFFIVEYRDNRMGDLVRARVEAEDECEAYEIASEDYYFGEWLETYEE